MVGCSAFESLVLEHFDAQKRDEAEERRGRSFTTESEKKEISSNK